MPFIWTHCISVLFIRDIFYVYSVPTFVMLLTGLLMCWYILLCVCGIYYSRVTFIPVYHVCCLGFSWVFYFCFCVFLEFLVISGLLTWTNIEKSINQTQHWATFTYSGKETRRITKLLKDTQNKNSIQNIQHNTKHSETTSTYKYNKSGIYQMKCLHCPLKYIGQTA
jgi:hypothetical protein